MCSCITKGQASLVLGKQRQRERVQTRRWAEEEADLYFTKKK